MIWHNRIRGSVLQQLSDDERRDRHRRLARVMESSGQTDPVQLGIHLRGAGETERAGEFFQQAADRAADALAFKRAADWYAESMALRNLTGSEQGVIRRRMADALVNAGLREDAGREYLAAAELLPDEEAVELQSLAATQFVLGGRLDLAHAALNLVGLPLPGTQLGARVALIVQRARLKIFGITFRERDSRAPMSHELRDRIDIAATAANALGFSRATVGELLQRRSLQFALRSGDPVRISLGMSGLAIFSALSGRRTEKATRVLLDAGTDLAGKIKDPRTLATAELARGVTAFLSGRFGAAGDHCRQAEQTLRSECGGAVQKLDTALIFGVWAEFYRGRLDALRERYHAAHQEAHERGDRYLSTTLGAQVGTFLLLVAAQPGAAREHLDALEGGWIADAFTIQHHNFLLARAQLDFVTGQAADACRLLEDSRRSYQQSGLKRVQHIRIDLEQLTGRCALGLLASDADHSGMAAKLAKRSIVRLRRERVGYADALAQFLSAGLAQCQGRPSAATAEYGQAATGLEINECELFARVARHCHEHASGDQSVSDKNTSTATSHEVRRCIAPWSMVTAK